MKKYDIFSRVCYNQSAADTSLVFGATCSKPSPFSIQGSLSEFPRIMAAKTLKKSLSLKDSDVQTFLDEEENQYTRRKPKVAYSSSFGNGFCRGCERKSTIGRFSTDRFWPLPKIFFLSVRTKSINENFTT